MLVKTYGCAVYGVDAIPITVEVNMDRGTKYFHVGLPDNAVKESQFRIPTAIKNSGFWVPTKKIIVNMAPADLRKEGSAYDLTIAIGILGAARVVDPEVLEDFVIMGELSLDGSLQPIKGALPIAVRAKANGFKGIILPGENAPEAAVVHGLPTYGVSNLKEVVSLLTGEKPLDPYPRDKALAAHNTAHDEMIDFSDVKGQETVKRALEVAAAGGHNILLVGPPGVGKTMLAKRIPGILPPMTLDESLETTKVHSVVGLLNNGSSLVNHRPFRSPHHTVSNVGLVGGGSIPKPGEISLAHNGVLFLDELPEFERAALEVLRQPLEDRVVTISRAKISVDYPASFMLVASMNPSPSGDFYDPNGGSPDSEYAVRRYLNKVSGPLMDRIDLHVEVSPVPYTELASKEKGEASRAIRGRVVEARRIQTQRFKDVPGIHSNAQLTPKLQERHCALDSQGSALLKNAVEKLGFSARSYGRLLKVARTIADLEATEMIKAHHIAEAIQYRSLDRYGWLQD